MSVKFKPIEATGSPVSPVSPIFMPALAGFPPSSAAASVATSGFLSGIGFTNTGPTAFLYRLVKPRGTGSTFVIKALFYAPSSGQIYLSARADKGHTVGVGAYTNLAASLAGTVLTSITTGSVTPGNSPADEDWITLELKRTPASETGGMAAPATLIGFYIDWA